MKKHLFSGLLIFLILHMTGNLPAGEIRIGYFGIAPHSYIAGESRVPAGAAVEFFSFIAKKMGYDVIWTELPPIRLIKYLKEGKRIDGALMFAKNSSRVKYLIYPSNPFYLARPNLIVRIDNPLSGITSIEDIRGYKLSQFSQAENSGFIRENQSKLKFDIITPGNNIIEQQLFRLILGRVDAVHTIDEYSVIFEAKRINKDNKIKVLFLPEPAHPLYTVFCKNSKGDTLSHKYDTVFKKEGLSSNAYIKYVNKELLLLDSKKIRGAGK